jgi:hypothetical protein
MIAPRYCHSADIGGACHFDVECGVANHDGIFGFYPGLAQRLKYHSRMWLGRRLVGGLDRAEMPLPSEPLQRGLDCMRKVPGGDPKTHVLVFRQRRQQVGGTAERYFRIGRVGTKQRQYTSVSREHLLDRRVRSGQLQENEFKGHSNQRETFFLARQSKSELTENDTIRFDNQFAAVDERAIEIKYYELHCNYNPFTEPASISNRLKRRASAPSAQR